MARNLRFVIKLWVWIPAFAGMMLLPLTSFSQVYEKPNFSFSSHPTLEIDRIELKEDRTLVYMTITNKRIGSSFCVDSNTCIYNSLGEERYRMTQSMGIPDCPEVHEFKAIGEKVSFILVFPPIQGDLKYIDIIEECPDACFSFKYVLLDAELNQKINQGLLLYEYGNLQEALKHFEDLMTLHNDFMSPVFGTVYLYLMFINYELGERDNVERLYEELKHSSILNKDDIIEAARFEGIIE
jgi:tetratricopeptide (TPR) repeat protein